MSSSGESSPSRPTAGNRWLVLAGLVLGLTLRLAFIQWAPTTGGDGDGYADLARNLLRHGTFGFTVHDGVRPTADRLPGYPAFLASIFFVTDSTKLMPVFLVQAALDLATCALIALLAAELASTAVAARAFFIAALCLPLANYVSNILTETLSTFLAAFTLLAYFRGLRDDPRAAAPWRAICGLSAGLGALVRPDALLLPALLLVHLAWLGSARRRGLPRARFALLLALLSVAPLIAWSARNLRQVGAAQVLPPMRIYPEPGVFIPVGFHQWVRTWIVDYSSVAEILWSVPGHNLMPLGFLPPRAFDSAAQKERTGSLFARYDKERTISPELDREFAALAAERIEASRARYYIWIPLARMASIWVHPRTDRLPVDSRWWRFKPTSWSVVIGLFCAAHLVLLGTALRGLAAGRVRHAGFLLLFLAVRTIAIAARENPEPRYLQVCLPIVLVFAAAGTTRRRAAQDAAAPAQGNSSSEPLDRDAAPFG